MSSFAEATLETGRLALVALVTLSLTGCYVHRRCGEAESCNYDDDDCDRRIDEDFLDEDGIYATLEHCGGCNVACPDVFPTAEVTECAVDRAAGTAECRIVSCPVDWHRAGDGACAPDVPALCLPCTQDSDCALRDPTSGCRVMPSGESRCLLGCGDGDGALCPEGFHCEDGIAGDFCLPDSGVCGCGEDTVDVAFGCIIERGDGTACAGARFCGERGLGECEPALDEACDGGDDDCDGEVDEDFRDVSGLYVARLHCGRCAQPCVEPGPNMLAECLPEPAAVDGVRCSIDCLEGFVDVDGIAANGCECERFDGEGPPPAIGGDADCDGAPDDTDDFIYVTGVGSDTNPGTLARPMRSLPAALARGSATAKDVLVAGGVYDGAVQLVAGVDVFGGYRPDFRDRDLTLFPVTLVNRGAAPGAPVVSCRGITTSTRMEGFTVAGSDATAVGEGSTAIYSDGCGAAVTFASIVVLSGRGADGVRGASSSDKLVDLGLSSLADLDGTDGGGGRSSLGGGTCVGLSAGSGGPMVCPAGNVSGGSGGGGGCPATGCTNGRPCGNGGCTDFTVGGVCDFDAVLARAVPNAAARPGAGVDGGAAGELTYDAPTNRGVCNFCDDNPTLPRNGGRGGDGVTGSDGMSGAGCVFGTALDTTTGRVAGRGGIGASSGTDGAGGGGGTSGAGYAVIGSTSGGCADRSGGAGGGGGSGGCGAPAADGGTGGGTSAGVVVRLGAGASSGPTFEDVAIVTASGGVGGDGGVGADGGGGGIGGLGGTADFWCARTGGRGGDGGRGGASGGGGGACGGGAHGVYVVPQGVDVSAYATRLEMGVTVEAVGVAGRGGRGGFSPAARGGDGIGGPGDAVLVGM